jgi:hypothetical protein
MVSSSSEDTLKFESARVHVDGSLDREADAILRVVGDFKIYLDKSCVYSESEFCLLEFAAAIADWVAAQDLGESAFVYTSLESEVAGLVRFDLDGEGAWRLSVFDLGKGERRDYPKTLGLNDLLSCVRTFVNDLWSKVPNKERVREVLMLEGATALVSMVE